MSLFDKKEDVIDIQLTPYGKHLLSQGKFKPSHYAFFDDDILYDGDYADIDEEQNNVQTRIEETPFSKTQYVFSGRGKSVQELTTLLTNANPDDDPTEAQKAQSTVERHYSLGSALGNSTLGNDKNPAWNVNFLKGDIESSSSYITGAKQDVRIPQLMMDPVSYTTEVKIDRSQFTNEQIEETLEGSLTMLAGKYPDDTYIVLDEDYLLLDVNELNADFDNDNFDIEVFKINDENVQFARHSTLRLDGSGDYVEIANHTGLQFDKEFSIEFHLKLMGLPRSDHSDAFHLFSSDWGEATPETTNFLFAYYNTASPYLRILANGISNLYYTKLELKEWYHLKIVRDTNNRIYLYLDDEELIGTTPEFTNSTTFEPMNSPWRLGVGKTYSYVNGFFDEFKITKGIEKKTQLLLHFNGFHETGVIVDSSDNNITCTSHGNAHIHIESFEELVPLSFLKQPVFIKDGLLLDEPEGGMERGDPENPTRTDEGYVEYWFDVFCDYEIDESVLCANLPKSVTRGGIFTQDPLNCPEKTITTPASTTSVTAIEEDEC